MRSEWTPFLSIEQFEVARKLGLTHALLEGNKSKELDLQIYRRKTLKENLDFDKKNIRNKLSGLRFEFDWIVVEPKSISTHIKTITNRMVDSIRISSSSPLKLVHQKYLRLMKINSVLLELDISCLFDESQKPKEIRNLIKIMDFVKQSPPNVVLVSTNPNTTSFRRYRNIQTIGEAFGIERKYTKLDDLIQRVIVNRKRKEGTLVSGDIEVDLK